jgi:hypothetical protein
MTLFLYFKKWLVGQVVTKQKIQEANDFYKLHFGSELFNEEGNYMYIYLLQPKDCFCLYIPDT